MLKLVVKTDPKIIDGAISHGIEHIRSINDIKLILGSLSCSAEE